MKNIFLIIAVLSASITLNAQGIKNRKATEISISAGVASPSGNFSKSDYADLKSGYAKSGLHLDLQGTHYLNKNLGISFVLGYNQYGFKNALQLADGYKEDSGTDSTTVITNGTNNSFSIMAGPVYHIPAGKNFSFNISALLGYINTHLAGFEVFFEDGLDNVLTQRKASGGGFGFQVGLDGNYKISRMLFLKAGVDYFYSRPSIDISYENFIVNSGRKLNTYKESITGVQVKLGFGLSF